MIPRTPLALLALASVLILAGRSPALAEGPVLLTVTGAIERTNRGPVDPEIDKLFIFNDVSFERAMQFDASALAALPQRTIRADFPKDGEMVEFTGPLLADALAAAGAEGRTVTIRAMDGYAIAAPLEELTEKGAMIALERDGRALGIGDFGPTQIVFPRGERADLAEMNDDWWIWQVYNIVVE